MSFRAAIVGLGNVGSAFDAGRREALPRTHVGALLNDADFELVAVCDPAPERRAAFASDWKLPCQSYDALDSLLAETKPDLLVIASTTSAHFDNVRTALEHGTRLVFCEKPFCDSYERAAQLTERARQSKKTIAVNYHRRWDTKMDRLRATFDSLSKPESVQVVYRKGLYNYGSHVVNLLQYFFGEVSAVAPRKPSDRESPSADLTFRSGLEARLTGIDGANYELFDADFFFRDAKFSIEFGGQVVREFRPRNDVFFPGYRSLVEVPDAYPTGPVHGLTAAYQEMARILRGEARTPKCSAVDALATLGVLDAIRLGSAVPVQAARSSP